VPALHAVADELSIIAKSLNVDPNHLVLNMPPQYGIWPGAIYTSNLHIPIQYGDANDRDIHTGNRVNITSNEAFHADVAGGAPYGLMFGLSADAGDLADLSISFTNARILDMSMKDLKNHIQNNPEVIDSIKSGQIPVVVIRVFEGVPTVSLTRKAGASVGAFAKLKADVQAQVSAAASDAEGISYQGTDDMVFAYETVLIDADLDKLGQGIFEYKFTSLPSSIYAFRASQDDKKLANALNSAFPSLGQYVTYTSDILVDRLPIPSSGAMYIPGINKLIVPSNK